MAEWSRSNSVRNRNLLFVKREAAPFGAASLFTWFSLYYLVLELGGQKLAVQTGDVAQRDAFGAFYLAGTGVGTVAKTQFVHAGHHVFGTTGSLYAALGQQRQLAHFGRDKKHGRAVFAGSHTGATANARSRIHSLIGIGLGNGQGVGIGYPSGIYRYITTGSNNFVEGGAVHNQVLNHGETGRTPGLYDDGFTVLELAHVQLTGRNVVVGPVGATVDVERAHATDAFAAVVVKSHRLFAFVDQLLIQNVHHFEEGTVHRYVAYFVSLETAFFPRTVLFPDFKCEIQCFFHD